MTVYGLTNCDTTKAAIKWLKQQKLVYTFHDYKLNGISEGHVAKWLEKIPMEKLLNKKSTTWRGLTAEQQSTASTKKGAIKLMAANTNLVKRPLIEWPDEIITAGFDEASFAAMMK
jgi:arsenate reductase